MEGDGPQLTFIPASLEKVRIKQLPSSAYYVADFISEQEEQVLLDKVGSRSCSYFCTDW
jgi:alkylated DNA repair protein alkB family protein 6